MRSLWKSSRYLKCFPGPHDTSRQSADTSAPHHVIRRIRQEPVQSIRCIPDQPSEESVCISGNTLCLCNIRPSPKEGESFTYSLRYRLPQFVCARRISNIGLSDFCRRFDLKIFCKQLFGTKSSRTGSTLNSISPEAFGTHDFPVESTSDAFHVITPGDHRRRLSPDEVKNPTHLLPIPR